MISRRHLLSGALALLFAPPDLVPPRKVWALGALPSERIWIPAGTLRTWAAGLPTITFTVHFDLDGRPDPNRIMWKFPLER